MRKLLGKSKMLIIGIIIGALLAIPLTALARWGQENLVVDYSDIKININGSQITPRDVTGRIVEPFIYEGTTFLPVRAISEALDKNVTWDGNTKTVYVLDKGTYVSPTDEELKTFLKSSETDNRVKEGIDNAVVTRITDTLLPVYILTATMPTGALEITYILVDGVDDDSNIQKVFHFTSMSATHSEQITSIIRNSSTSVIINTKYSNSEANEEETHSWYFTKIEDKWLTI